MIHHGVSVQVLSTKLARLRDLGDKYATQLLDEYAFDDEAESDSEMMESKELQALYDSMIGNISELMLSAERTEKRLLDEDCKIYTVE